MKLNKQKLEAVNGWFERHWPEGGEVVCPVCGSERWELVPGIFYMHQEPESILLEWVLKILPFFRYLFCRSLPIVPVGCKNCGNMFCFSAVSIGIEK